MLPFLWLLFKVTKDFKLQLELLMSQYNGFSSHQNCMRTSSYHILAALKKNVITTSKLSICIFISRFSNRFQSCHLVFTLFLFPKSCIRNTRNKIFLFLVFSVQISRSRRYRLVKMKIL